MPAPDDIHALLLNDVYASTDFNTARFGNRTPVDPAKLAGQTVNFNIITYDFVNGAQGTEPTGPTGLEDSDHHSPAGTGFPDRVGADGDRIYVDGDATEYYVNSTFRFDITVNYADGTSETFNDGARTFVLRSIRDTSPGPNHGSVIVSPLDTVRDTITASGKAVASMTLGAVEEETGPEQRGTLVQSTELTAQDNIMCFTRGTFIQTQDGQVAVEDLRVGDPIFTKNNGLQQIRWIGSRRISAEELDTSPNLRPVRISACTLGHGIPETDLIVSPQHRVLIRSKIAQRMFGAEEVLVAAKQFLALDGVDIAEALTEVEYFHLMFDQHEIIMSNGAETESLYAGRQALLAVGETARKEIFALLPELRNYPADITPAALLALGRPARQLVKRHKKNAQPFTCA